MKQNGLEGFWDSFITSFVDSFLDALDNDDDESL